MSQYLSVNDGSFVDPVSNTVIPNVYMAAGAVYGWVRNKSEKMGKRLMWAAIWGLAARLAPIPTGAVAAYKEGYLNKLVK